MKNFSWEENSSYSKGKSLILRGMMRTYEDLESELVQTKDLLTKALNEIVRLGEEVTKLKEQINRNSKNSSKPPSSDQKGNSDPDKPKRERRKRRGKARAPFPPERVDRHISCLQKNCPHCGSDNIQLNGQLPEILQQAELPEVRAIVTEYQLLKYGCQSCGKNSVADLPIGIPDSAFGPRLMGLLVSLTGVFHLAKREAIQLIKELYGIDMSLGSVPNIEERVAKALDPIYQRIHIFMMKSTCCKHFDETGWRDTGKRHFIWLVGCEHSAFYMIDRTRSSEAFRKLLTVSPDTVSAVTDRYAVYSAFKVHQHCLAHLIREFRSYAERDGPDKEIGEALEKELKTVCHVHKEYREGRIAWNQRNKRLGHRRRKVEICLEDGMANGSDELSKLCENLLGSFDKLWTFMGTPGMEPTNNLAERDLRKLVVWRKKSYGTRSERGKRFVERITSIAQTLKRQGKNILGFFQEVMVNFYTRTAPPFLSEAMGF